MRRRRAGGERALDPRKAFQKNVEEERGGRRVEMSERIWGEKRGEDARCREGVGFFTF